MLRSARYHSLSHGPPALLVYRVFRNEAKRTTKILHGLLHVLAFVIALVGECLARPALPPPPPTREAAAQLPSPLPLEAGTRPPRSWDQSPQVLASRGSLGSPPPSLPVSPVLTRPPPRPGLVAVFDYHRKKGIADLYSLHSWCGILVFVLFLAQVSPFGAPQRRGAQGAGVRARPSSPAGRAAC